MPSISDGARYVCAYEQTLVLTQQRRDANLGVRDGYLVISEKQALGWEPAIV